MNLSTRGQNIRRSNYPSPRTSISQRMRLSVARADTEEWLSPSGCAVQATPRKRRSTILSGAAKKAAATAAAVAAFFCVYLATKYLYGYFYVFF